MCKEAFDGCSRVLKAPQVTEGQHLMLDNRTSIDCPAAHHPCSSAQQQQHQPPVADRADRSIRAGGQIAGCQMESTGGFLSRFGDAIDDRVADMLGAAECSGAPMRHGSRRRSGPTRPP